MSAKPHCPLCAAKDELIEALEQRVADLQGMVREAPVPLEWRLTPQEARAVGLLLTREVATKDAIMQALYSDRPDADEPEQKIVDVFICKARKKLKPFGIEIETVWGRGYRIAQETRVNVLNTMHGRSAA